MNKIFAFGGVILVLLVIGGLGYYFLYLTPHSSYSSTASTTTINAANTTNTTTIPVRNGPYVTANQLQQIYGPNSTINASYTVNYCSINTLNDTNASVCM